MEFAQGTVFGTEKRTDPFRSRIEHSEPIQIALFNDSRQRERKLLIAQREEYFL